MDGRVWTLSNFLSVVRILLVIPVVVLLINDSPTAKAYAVGLILIGVATDYFDGVLARRLNQITNVGKILDPIADKIGIGVLAIVLAVQGKLESWLLGMILARDAAIFFGGLYVATSRRVVLQSTAVGKWAVTVLAVYFLVLILDVPQLGWLSGILLIGSVGMLVASTVVYAKRFIDVVFVPRENAPSR